MKNKIINANGTEIRVYGDVVNEDAYISLTDIAKTKNSLESRVVISNWLSSYSTIDFLALWESLYNPNFNRMEFHTVRNESGRLVMTPTRWIEKMNAIGITSKAGKYGGTYAHVDIAFEFASWISPQFKLYLIKDYQRLKKVEAEKLSIAWDVKRELSKINYKIHTDAVKEFLITPELTPQEMSYTYASEADVLNMALFGKTAAQWRNETGTKGMSPNIRDFASAEELVVLINLEDTNADLIRQGINQIDRLKILREKAYRQLQTLISAPMAGIRFDEKGVITDYYSSERPDEEDIRIEGCSTERFEYSFVAIPNPYEKGDRVRFAGDNGKVGIVDVSQEEWRRHVEKALKPDAIVDYSDASITVRCQYTHDHINPIYLEKVCEERDG